MSPQSRVVAVVSDDSLYAPLRYLPLGWELKQFPDVNSLMSHLRAGEYVDGVILADRYTGATLDDVFGENSGADPGCVAQVRGVDAGNLDFRDSGKG